MLNGSSKNCSLSLGQVAYHFVANTGQCRFIEKLGEYFGPDTPVDQIGYIDLLEAGQEICPTGQPQTIQRQVIVPFNAMVSFVRGQRPKQRAKDNVRKRTLSLEEAERLLKTAAKPELLGIEDPYLENLRTIAFLLGTGARPAEAFAAEGRYFDVDRQECYLAGIGDGACKTYCSPRWVWLPDPAFELVGEVPETGNVLRKPDGEPHPKRRYGGGQIAKHFNKIRDAADLDKDVVPYSLRHTWASWCYSQTKDLKLLMRRGGWIQPKTAMNYIKAVPLTLAEELHDNGWDFTKDPGPRTGW